MRLSVLALFIALPAAACAAVYTHLADVVHDAITADDSIEARAYFQVNDARADHPCCSIGASNNCGTNC